MKKRLREVIIITVATAGLLLVAEIVLRYFNFVPSCIVYGRYYENLAGDFEPNISVINHQPENYPYRFTANSQGIRSLREISIPKGKDVFRILCLGDSYTMGWGVDDHNTYPEKLYQYLSKKYPKIHFEVINAGMLFSNILDQYDYYKNKGSKLKPDLVIVQYCYNDIDTDFFRDVIGRQAMAAENRNNNYATTLSTLFSKTALGNFAAKLKYLLYYKYFNKQKDNPSKTNIPLHIKETIKKDEINALLLKATPEENACLQSENFAVLNEKNDRALQRLWTTYEKALLMLRELCAKDGAKFLFVAIPTNSQIWDNLNGHSCEFYPFTKAEGIPYIDFATTFRRLSGKDTEAFFLKADGHTNAAGDDIIAKEIAASVRFPPNGGPAKIVPPLFDRSCGNTWSISVVRSPDGALGLQLRDPKGKMLSTSSDGGLFKDVQLVLDGVGDSPAQHDSPDMIAPARAFTEKDAKATVTLAISTTKPFQNMDVISFRRVFKDGQARIVANYRFSPKDEWQPLYTYSAEKGGVWDGMEHVKINEVYSPEGHTYCELQFKLTGKAGLVLEQDTSGKAYRRLEIVLTPKEVPDNLKP